MQQPRALKLFIFTLAMLLAGAACAQATAARSSPARTATAVVAPAALSLKGASLDGPAFDLQSLRGRVVLLMYWSTDCAVCRDKMPEFRANAAGWSGKPFSLVTVSGDKKRQDLVDYERILARTVNSKERFVTLWDGEAGFQSNLGKPTSLPTSWLLDKSGKVVGQWAGRIPAEAWDQIADLL